MMFVQRHCKAYTFPLACTVALFRGGNAAPFRIHSLSCMARPLCSCDLWYGSYRMLEPRANVYPRMLAQHGTALIHMPHMT